MFDENSESIENGFNIDLEGIEYDAKFYLKELVITEGSEIGAAFGLAQLKKLDYIIETRKNNFIRQKEFLVNMKNSFNPEQLLILKLHG